MKKSQDKFSSYKNTEAVSQRSGVNDSVEGSLFDRDEEATDINIS